MQIHQTYHVPSEVADKHGNGYLTRRKHHDFITRRQHCVNIFTPGENGRFDNAESLFSGDKCLHIENQSPLNDFNFLSINLVSS